MRPIPLEEISDKFHKIELQNEKTATLYSVTKGIVQDIDPHNDIFIYRYSVPCPICDTPNKGAYSHDGEFFSNTQMSCSYCGVYFRPVKKRG